MIVAVAVSSKKLVPNVSRAGPKGGESGEGEREMGEREKREREGKAEREGREGRAHVHSKQKAYL